MSDVSYHLERAREATDALEIAYHVGEARRAGAAEHELDAVRAEVDA